MFICKNCSPEFYIETDDGGIAPLEDRWDIMSKSRGLCEHCGKSGTTADVRSGRYFHYESHRAKELGVYYVLPALYQRREKW